MSVLIWRVDEIHMAALIAFLWRVITFRATPDQMPKSRELLIVFFVLHWLTSLLISYLVAPTLQIKIEFSTIAMLNFLSLVVFLIYIHTVLVIQKLSSRFVQTMTTLLGVEILFALLVVLPMFLLQPSAAQGLIKPEIFLLAILYLFIMFVSSIWMFIVLGYILSKALDTKISIGILLIIGYKIIEVLLVK
jgi:hypothetical protein